MKNFIILLFSLIIASAAHAQVGTPDPSAQKVKVVPQDTNVKVLNVPIDTNSKKILVKDSNAHEENQYKGLLNDDPIYNHRYPWWQPALKVMLQNLLLNLFDHYVLNLEWS